MCNDARGIIVNRGHQEEGSNRGFGRPCVHSDHVKNAIANLTQTGTVATYKAAFDSLAARAGNEGMHLFLWYRGLKPALQIATAIDPGTNKAFTNHADAQHNAVTVESVQMSGPQDSQMWQTAQVGIPDCWEGYSEEDDTWEPAAIAENAADHWQITGLPFLLTNDWSRYLVRNEWLTESCSDCAPAVATVMKYPCKKVLGVFPNHHFIVIIL